MNIIEELVGLISDKFIVIKTMKSIFNLEMRLAGLSVFPLVLTVLALLGLLIGLWLTVNLTIGYFIKLYFSSISIALLSILLFNVLVLFILLKCLARNLKLMSFEKTRKYLLQVENETNEPYKKTIADKNSPKRKDLTASSG